MMPRAQSTRLAGQYFSTVERQYSTSRIPPESAGQFGDHLDDVGAFVVVVDFGAGWVVVDFGAGWVVVDCDSS
jgi:hypothetical protein